MKKRGFGLIVIILLLFIPIYVKAERGNKELNSIKINSTVNNVNIKIFKVADILDSECHLNDNFKNYPVNCNNLNYALEYRDLAYTLEGYIKRDDIKSDFELKTNTKGIANIKNLKNGLYLIMNDNNNYISEPILINLPSQNIDGTYEYSTNIYPKYIKLNNIDTFYDKEIEINWLDKGYGNYRPKQVTIELLENNILKEELVVSRLDNWHKTIKSLNSNKTYNIVIKDLNNYDISICNDYDKFIIYNTFNNKNIVKENILNTKILNNNLINYRLIKGNFVTPIDLRLEAI